MKTNIGVPVILLKALEKFKEIGPKLTGLGFLDDKSWEKKRWPYGIVKSKHQNKFAVKRLTTNKIAGISCAACHTGQLPDGRFSIGMTNEKLKYGMMNQYTLFTIWMVDRRKNDTSRWLPELIKKYTKMRKDTKSFFMIMLSSAEKMPINKFLLRNIVGEEPPSLATQRSFLNSEPGIFNGFAPSLNFSDKELYVSAPGVWALGTEDEAHYGTLAAKKTTSDFISEAFLYTNRSKKYNKAAYLEPVAEYLKCLKSPKPLKEINTELHASGKKIFKNNCMTCHDLNHGGGSKSVDPERIQTPETFINIFSDYKPEDIQSMRTFSLIQDLSLNNSATRIKVRRLNGIWTRKNLTSNGQIKGMDHLFCLNGKKREIVDKHNPKTQGIHEDLCTQYSDQEKEALKEFLQFF